MCVRACMYIRVCMRHVFLATNVIYTVCVYVHACVYACTYIRTYVYGQNYARVWHVLCVNVHMLY